MSRNNRADPDDRSNSDVDVDTDRRDERTEHDREERVDYEENPSESGKWISAVIALLGLWMIGQAFVIDVIAAQFWSDVLVGVLLVGVGGYNYSQRASEHLANSAAALIAVAAGLWLIVAPFVLGVDTGFTETLNVYGFWNDIVVGLLAIGLGAYSAYTARDNQEDTHRAAT